MPLIDIRLAISGLDSSTLEQAGIIANFLAGLLLASEYFFLNDKIDKINNYLEHHISTAYNMFSRKIKILAKWNRKLIAITFLIVFLLSVYQIIFHSASTIWDYIRYYYSIAKLILMPMREVLMASLFILAVMFVILFIARSTPKKMIGAFAILSFLVGNMLLFLSTLFE
jgi:hypothetical protein